MAQSYTRQSTFSDGDTITASLFNNEYNQLLNAFSYSSSSATTTGHRHDGTAGEGGNIHTIGDLDFLNKIVVDSTNNRWGVYVEVSGAAVEQVRIQDGAIVPVTDNDIDLGTSSLEFKDLYLDGTATIDTLAVDANATVAGTLGVTGATTLSSTLGVTGATTLSSTLGVTGATTLSSTLAVTGTSTLTGNVTTTNDLSVGGNLTVTGNATISGNLTFGDAATDTVTLSADVASSILPSADNTYDLGATGSEWRDLYIDGTANIDSLVADTADINAGTIDNTAIGGSTASSGAFTTLSASGATTLSTTLGVTGATTLSSTLAVTGAATLSSDLTVNGNTTLGNAASDTVTVTADVASNLIPSADSTYSLGDSSNYWSNGYIDAVTTTGDVSVGGNLTVTGNATISGNLTFGDAATDTVSFSADVSSNLLPSADNTYDLGASGSEWKDLYIDGTAYVDAIDLNGTAITATAAELNILDGVTATASELNILDGVTSTTAELNILDGVTSTASELNILDGVTSTAAELNLLDGSTANTVVNSKAVVYGSSGELAGTLSTAAQTNVTSLGTLSSLTVSGDLTVDTSTLKVDSSNNRVGILNTSPDVTLDIGSATDAVHVPVGTTAQRPGSPAAGYFRYNTSLAQFEGYTDAWGAIGGGGTNTFTHDVFTCNGSTTAFTLSQSTESENNLIVFVDGVFQEQGAYSIATSGGVTTLTMSAAPANGRKLVVYTVAAGVSGSNLNIDTMTGDGSDTTLTLSINPVNENNTQVFIDGVYQSKSNYSISGTTLTFSTAPPNGSSVEVMTMTQTDINVPVDGTITSAKLSGDLTLPGDLSFADSNKAIFGAGSDLQIYHDGNNKIEASSGYLRLAATTASAYLDGNNVHIRSGDGGETLARFNDDSDVKLYYDNSQKLATTSSGINVTGTVTVSSSTPTLQFTDTDNNYDATIQGLSGSLVLTADSGAEFGTESIQFKTGGAEVGRFDASGKLLIGDSASHTSDLLQIETPASGGGHGIQIRRNDANGDQTIGTITFGNNTDTDLAQIKVKTDGDGNSGDSGALLFSTQVTSGSLTERMRIDSVGNVGIGRTPSSVVRLSVAGSDSGSSNYAFEATNSAANTKFVVRNDGLAAFYGSDHSESMRIDSSGKVGIGTGSPAAKLEVALGAEGEYLRIGGDNSSNSRALTFTSSTATSNGALHTINAASSNGVIALATGGSEAMRIDSNGNVLVGTTNNSPVGNNVAGAGLFPNGSAQFSRDGGIPLFVNRKTSDGTLIDFRKDGTTVGAIDSYSSTIQFGQGNVNLRFDNSNDQIIPANDNGTGNDDDINLGAGGARFDDIYATNGTIQTSDRNEKQDIEELSDAEQRVAVAAKGLLRKFRWKSSVAENGDDARIHFGIIAQDLQAAFEAEGLDAGRYAMFINSTWTDEETGEERSRMGVRYSELLAFIIAAI